MSEILPPTNFEAKNVPDPAQERQRGLERQAGKLTNDQCLVERQLDCSNQLFQIAEEEPPLSAHEQLTRQVEAFNQTALETSETIVPNESVQTQTEATRLFPEEQSRFQQPENTLLRSMNMSEGEQWVLEDIQGKIQRGENLSETDQQVIAFLGKKLEQQGAERAKELITSLHPDIPGIADMPPNEAIQFADQFAKVKAIHGAFKGAKDAAWSSRALNKTWEFFSGKDMVDAGVVGQGLQKLQNGEPLSPEEMEHIVAKSEFLDASLKAKMYAEVGQDMIERMLPGVNIAKDGFTAQALTADAINTISILAMGLSGGASVVANMSAKGQRIVRGIATADLAATAYGVGEGAKGMYEAVQDGNNGGIALNGAMILMGALGTGASLKTLKEVQGLEPIPVGLSTKLVDGADSPTPSIFPEHIRPVEELRHMPVEKVGSFEELQAWIQAKEKGGIQGATEFYQADDLVDTVNRVRRGELGEESIPRAGGLRDKIQEFLARQKLAKGEVALDPKKIDVQIHAQQARNADVHETNNAIDCWSDCASGDPNWGRIIEPDHMNQFRNSNPQILELGSNNNTKVKILYPQKYAEDVQKLQTNLTTVERQFQEYFANLGVNPKEEVTLLFMENSPTKQIRGHAKTDDILMNANDLRNPDHFLDTYIHERTHAILQKNQLYPHNPGLVEGIANVMPDLILKKLGHQSEISTRGLRDMGEAITDRVQGGQRHGEAMRGHFDDLEGMAAKEGKDLDYNLSYEYGQAFVRSFVDTHGMEDFLKLYKEVGRAKYRGMDVVSSLENSMRTIGMSKMEVDTVIESMSKRMMLKGMTGERLFASLLDEPIERVRAKLQNQDIYALLDMRGATRLKIKKEAQRILRNLRKKRGNSQSISLIARYLNNHTIS